MKKGIVKWSAFLTTLFVLNLGVIVITHESGRIRIDLSSQSVASAVDYIEPLPIGGYQKCWSGHLHFYGSRLTYYCGLCEIRRMNPTYQGTCRIW